jgi:hypothetical protein
MSAVKTLTVVKREDGDGANVDFVEPLWEFCIRHFAQYIQLGPGNAESPKLVLLRGNFTGFRD